MTDGGTSETGPGVIETSLVIGLSVVLALVILLFFGGALADIVAMLVNAAHGGR